jgi:recombination protein RecR
MEFPSKIVEEAVAQFARLPGIGKKTALRMVLHLLKQDIEPVRKLTQSLLNLKTELKYCKECHNISDSELCNICADAKRDHEIICVVEDLRDVMAIENTNQFRGVYHVLGGIISPVDGVGPGDLNIESLYERIHRLKIKEIIFAFAATMEGDTTAFYITKRLQPANLKISSIARGIAIGGELEYADEITLGRSIISRVPYGV